MAITNLTGTKWVFNEYVSLDTDGSTFYINFKSNNKQYSNLWWGDDYIGFGTNNSEDVVYDGQQIYAEYRTIIITGGDDVENTKLISLLQANATQIKDNLANTKWRFKENIYFSQFDLDVLSIIFKTNNNEYSYFSAYGNTGKITYTNEDGDYIHAYENSKWTNQAYRTIEIIGGGDVEDQYLFAFLNTYATLITKNFNETKTALKIYEDLTQEEYDSLEKDNNTFYQVNEVGVYKGEKLIAINSWSLDKPIYSLEQIDFPFTYDSYKNIPFRLGQFVEIQFGNRYSSTKLICVVSHVDIINGRIDGLDLDVLNDMYVDYNNKKYKVKLVQLDSDERRIDLIDNDFVELELFTSNWQAAFWNYTKASIYVY